MTTIGWRVVSQAIVWAILHSICNAAVIYYILADSGLAAGAGDQTLTRSWFSGMSANASVLGAVAASGPDPGQYEVSSLGSPVGSSSTVLSVPRYTLVVVLSLVVSWLNWRFVMAVQRVVRENLQERLFLAPTAAEYTILVRGIPASLPRGVINSHFNAVYNDDMVRPDWHACLCRHVFRAQPLAQRQLSMPSTHGAVHAGGAPGLAGTWIANVQALKVPPTAWHAAERVASAMEHRDERIARQELKSAGLLHAVRAMGKSGWERPVAEPSGPPDTAPQYATISAQLIQAQLDFQKGWQERHATPAVAFVTFNNAHSFRAAVQDGESVQACCCKGRGAAARTSLLHRGQSVSLFQEPAGAPEDVNWSAVAGDPARQARRWLQARWAAWAVAVVGIALGWARAYSQMQALVSLSGSGDAVACAISVPAAAGWNTTWGSSVTAVTDASCELGSVYTLRPFNPRWTKLCDGCAACACAGPAVSGQVPAVDLSLSTLRYCACMDDQSGPGCEHVISGQSAAAAAGWAAGSLLGVSGMLGGVLLLAMPGAGHWAASEAELQARFAQILWIAGSPIWLGPLLMGLPACVSRGLMPLPEHVWHALEANASHAALASYGLLSVLTILARATLRRASSPRAAFTGVYSVHGSRLPTAPLGIWQGTVQVLLSAALVQDLVAPWAPAVAILLAVLAGAAGHVASAGAYAGLYASDRAWVAWARAMPWLWMARTWHAWWLATGPGILQVAWPMASLPLSLGSDALSALTLPSGASFYARVSSMGVLLLLAACLPAMAWAVAWLLGGDGVYLRFRTEAWVERLCSCLRRHAARRSTEPWRDLLMEASARAVLPAFTLPCSVEGEREWMKPSPAGLSKAMPPELSMADLSNELAQMPADVRAVAAAEAAGVPASIAAPAFEARWLDLPKQPPASAPMESLLASVSTEIAPRAMGTHSGLAAYRVWSLRLHQIGQASGLAQAVNAASSAELHRVMYLSGSHNIGYCDPVYGVHVVRPKFGRAPSEYTLPGMRLCTWHLASLRSGTVYSPVLSRKYSTAGAAWEYMQALQQSGGGFDPAACRETMAHVSALLNHSFANWRATAVADIGSFAYESQSSWAWMWASVGGASPAGVVRTWAQRAALAKASTRPLGSSAPIRPMLGHTPTIAQVDAQVVRSRLAQSSQLADRSGLQVTRKTVPGFAQAPIAGLAPAEQEAPHSPLRIESVGSDTSSVEGPVPMAMPEGDTATPPHPQPRPRSILQPVYVSPDRFSHRPRPGYEPESFSVAWQHTERMQREHVWAENHRYVHGDSTTESSRASSPASRAGLDSRGTLGTSRTVGSRPGTGILAAMRSLVSRGGLRSISRARESLHSPLRPRTPVSIPLPSTAPREMPLGMALRPVEPPGSADGDWRALLAADLAASVQRGETPFAQHVPEPDDAGVEELEPPSITSQLFVMPSPELNQPEQEVQLAILAGLHKAGVTLDADGLAHFASRPGSMASSVVSVDEAQPGTALLAKAIARGSGPSALHLHQPHGEAYSVGPFRLELMQAASVEHVEEDTQPRIDDHQDTHMTSTKHVVRVYQRTLADHEKLDAEIRRVERSLGGAPAAWRVGQYMDEKLSKLGQSRGHTADAVQRFGPSAAQTLRQEQRKAEQQHSWEHTVLPMPGAVPESGQVDPNLIDSEESDDNE